MNYDKISEDINQYIAKEIEKGCVAWLEKAKGIEWTDAFIKISKENLDLRSQKEGMQDALVTAKGLLEDDYFEHWEEAIDVCNEALKRYGVK